MDTIKDQGYIDELLSIEKNNYDGKGNVNRVVNIDFNIEPAPKLIFSGIDKSNIRHKFLLEIRTSNKDIFRINLHHQDNTSNFCLVRIDFLGTHTNPQEVNEYVPDFLKKYSGQRLTSSHRHYSIQGYRSSAWAIPLSDLPDRQLNDNISEKNYYECLNEAITYIRKCSNIRTKICTNTILKFEK